MGDFDKYNQMNITEFIEMLGRMAELTFTETIPLANKIERLLGYFLPPIKFQVKKPELDFDIESESDYDDDWVDEITQDALLNGDSIA
jgi:hypothetical protein